MHRRVLTICLVLFSIFSALNAQSDDSSWFWNKTITKVEFRGLKNVKKTELTAVSSDYIGEPFTEKNYSDIVDRISELDYFEDINAFAEHDPDNPDNVVLVFEVVEKPVIASIEFKGNYKIRNNELREVIKSKTSNVYIEGKILVDERLIRDHYIEKGFTDSVVTHKVEQTEEGIKITFIITEGVNTVITEIHVMGNSVFSEKSLLGKISLKPEGFWNDGAFKNSALEMDKKTILNLYQQEGYIDVQIVDVKIKDTFNKEKQRQELSITFVIQEGSVYTYKGITLKGNQIFTTETLLSGFKLKEGQIFNSVKFQEGLNQIQGYYIDNGYMTVQMNPVPNKNPETREISYTITIVEGQRSHVEHIIIKGNSKTKEEVIRREIPLEEGDILSRDKIVNGLRNLYNLQYFSNVVPDIQPGSEPNLYDVIFSVEEQNTISLNMGMTISEITNPDDIPIALNFTLQNSNLFGEGRNIGLQTNLSKSEQSIGFSYGQSWINDMPISYNQSVSFAHKHAYTPQNMFLPDLSLDQYYYYMLYEGYEASIGTAFGRRWFPEIGILTVTGGMNNSLTRYSYDESLFTPTDLGVSMYANRWGIMNSLFASVSLDNRDIAYDPSKGWFASQRFTWYGLIPGLEKEFFLKSETKLEGYLTLFDVPLTEDFNFKGVLAAYSGFSLILPTSSSLLSDSNRLYIDGRLNGRGWINLSNYTINKGQAMWATQLELRIPIVPNVIGIDFFHDTVILKPTLSDMITDMKLEDFYFSFGPAIRILIPQFPLHLMFTFRYHYDGTSFKWADSPYEFVLSFNLANK